MTTQQLKNSILQMAVQGKLVPQNPDDERASVLLERIRTEKEALIKVGKIKREKNPSVIFRGADGLPYEKVGGSEPVCIADEVPFEIPDSWEWVRIESCSEMFNGKAFKPSDWTKTGLPIVRIQNLNDDKAPFNYFDKDVPDDVHLFGGELLFAWSGTPGTSFGAHIWNGGEAVLNQHIFKMTFDEHSLFKKYFMYALNERVGSLIKVAHGSAGLQHITRGVFESTLIPLPPLAEQHRIVAKIEELLPCIAKYDQAESQLAALNAGFPAMLKKSILQEAVQGRLVPQNPDDESAAALLERIRKEKARLVREGKIKKGGGGSVIFRRDGSHYERLDDGSERRIDDEVPFEIPEGWEWVRCSSIGTIVRGSGIKRTETAEQGMPCIRYGEIYTSYNISFTQTKSFVPKDLYEKCKHISYGDIVFTLTGENKPDIAKAIAYFGETPVAAGGDLAFWTCHGMNPLYLMYFLNSPYAIERKIQLATGDIIVHISGDKIGSILLPLPPLAEQKRIVAKIEELMRCCEML